MHRRRSSALSKTALQRTTVNKNNLSINTSVLDTEAETEDIAAPKISIDDWSWMCVTAMQQSMSKKTSPHVLNKFLHVIVVNEADILYLSVPLSCVTKYSTGDNLLRSSSLSYFNGHSPTSFLEASVSNFWNSGFGDLFFFSLSATMRRSMFICVKNSSLLATTHYHSFLTGSCSCNKQAHKNLKNAWFSPYNELVTLLRVCSNNVKWCARQ